jgi:hypothetical protein
VYEEIYAASSNQYIAYRVGRGNYEFHCSELALLRHECNVVLHHEYLAFSDNIDVEALALLLRIWKIHD